MSATTTSAPPTPTPPPPHIKQLPTNHAIAADDDVIESHTSNWSVTQRELYSEYIAQQQLNYEPVIKTGDRVVLEAGEKILIVHMKPDTKIPLRGKQVKIDSLIGQPLNSTFCYDNGTFKRRLDGRIDIESVFAELEEKELDKDFMPTSTNKDLIARQDNQTMTAEAIEQLKSSNISATDIIKHVTAASSTWEGKTEFSQLKWLKKKWAKYNQDVTSHTPTVFNLRKITGGPDEIRQENHMRDDTFAQILSMANIGHGMRCIVVDSTDGLVSGSVQRRMGDSGATLLLHTGRNSQQGLLDLNLTQSERQRVIASPFDALPSYGWAGNTAGWLAFQQQEIDRVKAELKDKLPSASDLHYPLMTNHTQNFLQHKALAAIICHWTYDPLSLLLPILPHLLPSSPIVLWSPTIEPLVTAMHFLQTNQIATQLHLQDTWFRPLQVLPNRTHPHMNMEANGGFLLYGFTLDYYTNYTSSSQSHLHPSFQVTNNALNYAPIPQPNRFNNDENNQRSVEMNRNGGKKNHEEKQEQNKRKWQPQDKDQDTKSKDAVEETTSAGTEMK